jgi:hypothetical protein
MFYWKRESRGAGCLVREHAVKVLFLHVGQFQSYSSAPLLTTHPGRVRPGHLATLQRGIRQPRHTMHSSQQVLCQSPGPELCPCCRPSPNGTPQPDALCNSAGQSCEVGWGQLF